MSKKDLRKVICCFGLIIIVSFLLNYFWESLHGFSLYKDHIINSDKYVGMMVYMSFMDALSILGIYVFISFLKRDVFWFKNMRTREFAIFFIFGLIMAIIAEYWAVYVSHKWHYNHVMPIILGIGLSPLVQLSITGVLSLWLVKKIVNY